MKTGHQSNAAAETQEIFNKFDSISDKVKVILKVLILIYFSLLILFYSNSDITQSA